MAGGGQVSDQAFVTLATNDTYALGALVLAHSLRRAGTTRQLAIMVTPGVTQGIRSQLSQVFDLVQQVDVLDSRDQVNLALLTRPDLGITFTKLHCWRLTQYSKCVFLDADTLVLSNVDELFEREELSAAPDAGWPDCFNSGVFVFRPSEETYQSLLQFAVSQGSFDGGDQGLLNMYFSDWATKDIAKHLPFIYNCVSQAFYSYLPAFRFYGKTVKIVHFIGATKPWHHAFNTTSGQVETGGEPGTHFQYLQLWWQLFMEYVQPSIDPGLGCKYMVKWPKFRYFMVTYYKFSRAMKTWLRDKTKKSSTSKLARLLRIFWEPSPDCSPHNQGYIIHTSYTPPNVEVFYQPNNTPSPTLVYVDNRNDRPFTFFEAFYSEPPMTTGDEYPTAQDAYDAKHFEQELQGFAAHEHHTHTEVKAEPQAEEPQTFHGQIDQSHHLTREQEWYRQEQEREEARRQQEEREKALREQEEKEREDRAKEERRKEERLKALHYQEIQDLHETKSQNHKQAKADRQPHKKHKNRNSRQRTSNDSSHSDKGARIGVVSASAGAAGSFGITHEHRAASSLVGFQAGVAKIGTFSPQELSDPNRRYQWERGQIDYTGIDSFDNIEKRLQQMMSSKEEAKSLGPVAGEPPKPQVPLTPSGRPLKPALKQPAKSALRK